jgi:hypothetical protein
MRKAFPKSDVGEQAVSTRPKGGNAVFSSLILKGTNCVVPIIV